MIHLRCILDESGDTVDLTWFCSRSCYLDSLRLDPPDACFEEGGGYPCGAESDSPDFCEVCGAPVGNPLTADGLDYAQELITRGGPLANALHAVYPSLIGGAR